MSFLFCLLMWQVFWTSPVDPRFGVAGAAITHDRVFGLSELTDITASVVWNGFRLPVEAGISSFGFHLYRETRIRGGTRFTYGDLRAGLVLESRFVAIKNFESISRHSVDARFQYPILPDIDVGVLFTNVFAEKDVPQIGSVGVSGALHPTLRIEAWVWKDVTFDADVNLRARWSPHPTLELMGGRSTNPGMWTLGIRLRLDAFRFGFEAREHAVLGWSETIEAAWLW
jgi:hypothetical protein